MSSETSNLRIVFMGTPWLARTVLEHLLSAPGILVIAVVTQPDRPKGRDLKLTASPVKELALKASLPVLQPNRARDAEFLSEIGKLNPDMAIVAAFGQILPQVLLDIPKLGCLNVHTSLLPKYRGAAPIQWAIIDGEHHTGVTIMKMDAGLDTGPILTQESTPIGADEDSESLHDRLASIGGKLLVKTIPDYAHGKIQPRPQPVEAVSYARKITKEDGRIDWTLPAPILYNRIRGLSPWPGAFTHLAGKLIKLWKAEMCDTTGPAGTILTSANEGILVGCGEGSLRVLLLQREGGRRLTASQFRAGKPLAAGERFD